MSKRPPIRSASIRTPRSRSSRHWIAAAAIGLLIVGASLLLLFRKSGDARVAGRPDQPDIILITIDTLRADATGFAGNAKVRTPFLDRMATEGLVFTQTHAHNVVTLASHVNILTGRYPYQHGVRDNAGFTLDAKVPTLAGMLQQQGYATGAFVGAFPLDARYGLNRGFDVYDDRYREGASTLDFEVQERPAPEVLDAATKWFTSVSGRKRFLWVHLYDPHAPYQPRGDFAKEYWDHPYLGEVAATDDALGKSLGPILDANPNALVLLTADHGEALGEHGELTHGLFAYESTLKVPLILREPGRVRPGREDRPVRHVDIVPTILRRLGVAIPADLPGSPLLEIEGPRDSYFESLSASVNRGWAPLVGMIHGQHKYIDLPLPELYDLTRDPAESSNLYRQDRRTVTQIRKLLSDRAPAPVQASRTLSTEESSNLLSLGYISGTAASKKSYAAQDDPKTLIDIDTKMHKVVELYQLGQIQRSIQLAREVVGARPDMAVGREMLAFVLQQGENSEAAIETLQESIRKGNSSESTRVRLGKMLSELGRAAEAVTILEPLAARTSDPDVLNAYGIALADLGNLKSALIQFDRALQLDQTNATAYQNLGIVALRAGEIERSRQYLEQALKLNDRLPLALNTMGVVEARRGNHSAALDFWRRAVALDPKQYDALYNIALVSARSGRMAEADEVLARFVETAPPQRYAADIANAKRMRAEIRKRAGGS